jgi:LemA protein
VRVLIVLVIVLVVVVIMSLWVAGVYNGLVRLRNLVQEAWWQIDVEITRRHDLIPNLVETVFGYAAHERQILGSVARAQAVAVSRGMSVRQQAAAESDLTSALGQLFAVAQAYPELEADQNYLALQAELTEIEDRVAACRRFYNANVRELNTRVESFPPRLFASVFHFKPAEYFEVSGLGHGEAPAVTSGTVAPPSAGSSGGAQPFGS